MFDTFIALSDDWHPLLNNFVRTQPVEYVVDLSDSEIFRVDDSTSLLIDDYLRK